MDIFYFCCMINRRYGILILLLSITVIGLLWSQYYWINTSYELKGEELKTNANAALKAVATNIEESYYCIDFFSDFNAKKGDRITVLKDKFDTNAEVNKPDTIPTYFWHGKNYDTLQSYNAIVLPLNATIQMKLSVQYQMWDYADTNAVSKNASDFTINSYRNSIYEDPGFIKLFDSLLVLELHNNGIDFENKYIITEENNDSVIYSNANKHEFLNSEIKTTIFRDNYFYNPLEVYVDFPDKKLDMIKELWGIAFISFFILIAIVLLIAYIFKTIINEGKLSEMKLDFIGNMTHEFRTPVANINLALDTLDNQNHVIPEKSQYIFDILREENKRMQNNIESILESGFHDTSGFNLKKEPIIVNEILQRVVDSFQLEIKETNGLLICNLPNKSIICLLDRTHFSNAFSNIIDNAINYCNNSPNIIVNLNTTNKFCQITIIDTGIGMPAFALNKVFDKFYRVPAGNIHNTKGFGLGLSYTKKIVEEHGGKISASSKMGEGSTFVIQIPLT